MLQIFYLYKHFFVKIMKKHYDRDIEITAYMA